MKGTCGGEDMPKNQRKTKRKLPILLLRIVLLIAGTGIAFLGFFYVTKVEIAGSTRYTDAEVKNMVMDNFWHHNSFILSLTRKVVVPENAPFIESIEVRKEAHNKIRLIVNEKIATGYVLQEGNRFYFSNEGIVLDIIPDEEAGQSDGGEALEAASSASSRKELQATSDRTSQKENTAGPDNQRKQKNPENQTHPEMQGKPENPAGPDHQGKPEAQPEYAPLEAVTADSTKKEGPSRDGLKTSEQKEYRPAVANVPRVTGLTKQTLRKGDVIQPEQESDAIFQKLQAITRLVNRFSQMPDEIRLSKEGEITLHYDKIDVPLGQGLLLDEQISRMAAILPQLEGKEGTLHLENYSEDTINIIFDEK